ncbi:hypothetical protein HBI25_018140 [Parastagonospora nodorum]|nr:hypothetical protein HBI10_105540 [Parastagonospora nodorum]KAH4010027.1 hypothetical protein HBI13_213130 [Parastagonospora nodorum]KAH4207127.1 hypothetical protein HBI95_112620 [Parastagonospora nodorum]KAH4904830.1 hypothetical protein HBH74_179760 [Parastagonospora nodorum]KAH4907113.1 hypothetical protein HBI80_074170 [Parastagonospora nodorum]
MSPRNYTPVMLYNMQRSIALVRRSRASQSLNGRNASVVATQLVHRAGSAVRLDFMGGLTSSYASTNFGIQWQSKSFRGYFRGRASCTTSDVSVEAAIKGSVGRE